MGEFWVSRHQILQFFFIEKANLLENTIFYINQAYQSFKDGKKVYYNDVFILAQIMPLAQQPKEIKSYEPQR